MRDRAGELYDYLVNLIQHEDIPLSRTGGEDAQGGVILVGWSFGSVWATAFLAHEPSFHSDINLGKWVRRVVSYAQPGSSGRQSLQEYTFLSLTSLCHP
ncbi:hypothetical protein DICSQDRAFT_173368 [Dichomitus squalens LYAD-421 SS1]|uniref:Uncharacterized protein n=1 Tax=Dichomitus squalens (strain LYAD-421) TaxID=732165 RepID=R7SPH4_DICSQ|nr:uncharacterized protein DICSQDRAFT_173368 [Dichomitus squalens LYAD-421 SS1]EJF58001.1 hypothetical protein DICSQDRAFT_173368 [Dichomitus squalens LYAD-421 SS1]